MGKEAPPDAEDGEDAGGGGPQDGVGRSPSEDVGDGGRQTSEVEDDAVGQGGQQGDDEVDARGLDGRDERW